MPPYVEAQHVAVALQGVFSELLDLNRTVFSGNQTLPEQALAVILTGLVETPVLRNPEGGIFTPMYFIHARKPE